MKKLFLIAITIFVSIIVFGQKNYKNQVVVLNDSVYSGNIESYLGKKIIFESEINSLGSKFIPISDVIEVRGEMPNFRKKAILKNKPNVKFVDQLSDNDFNVYGYNELKKEDQMQHYDWSGDYLIKAGSRYLTGIGLGFLGGVIAGVGISQDNNQIAVLGGITAITGSVISLSGHFQLIKAGKALNKELSLTLNNEGLGLCLNF